MSFLLVTKVVTASVNSDNWTHRESELTKSGFELRISFQDYQQWQSIRRSA
jgi:hypothetical protein